MTKEDQERFKWFAVGATAVLFDEGRGEWDIWLTLSPKWDINLHCNGESFSAIAYQVKDGVVDTTDSGIELIKGELK
jgi:hypothetical protein